MISIAVILLALIIYILYLRYFPVFGTKCIELDTDQFNKEKLALDIRDYNTSAKNNVKGSVAMPVAYLKRYYRDIPSKELHIIASDRMEKNVAIRFLRSKGYRIISYSLTNCDCKDKAFL